MMTKKFEQLLEELAEKVATKALLDDTPFPEKLDAFKVLTAYDAARSKRKKLADPNDGEGFARFGRQLREAEEGSDGAAPIRSGGGH